MVFIGLNERGKELCNEVEKVFKPLFNGVLNQYNIKSKRNADFNVEISDNNNFETSIFNNKTVIIFDDVVDSGQTLMYAAAYFLNFNPKALKTLALIDRNHRKFPIKVDYVGLQVATTMHEHVVVEFDETNNENNCAYLK